MHTRAVLPGLARARAYNSVLQSRVRDYVTLKPLPRDWNAYCGEGFSFSKPSSYRPMSAGAATSSGARPGVAVQSGSSNAGPSSSDSAPPVHLTRMKANFCRQCGSSMDIINQGGNGKPDWRHVCSNKACGYIDYFNPKMVVGCIVEHQGKILLCRRAIEPCKGLWTVPAGFMELNESTAEGAARETWEEANARVHIIAPFAHWDIPAIGQAYILFRAQLAEPFTHSAGVESLETALFEPKDIPFDKLAFSSVATSLTYYLQDLKSGKFPMHHGVIDKAAGSSPNDPTTFCVRSHVTLPAEV